MASIAEIEAQFNAAALEYDAARRTIIPCFDDYYENAAAFVVRGMTPPARILDLGAGTGLLTTFYFRHFPHAEYVLTDIAESMLSVAKKRFLGMDNISYSCSDYSNFLPAGQFDLVISGLSIHHLENDRKQALFLQIQKILSPDGVFVNHDQFSANTPEMTQKMDDYWEFQLIESGLPHDDLEKWRERRKLDRECSVNEEIAMLKNSGFPSVDCIYCCQKLSVIAAYKSRVV